MFVDFGANGTTLVREMYLCAIDKVDKGNIFAFLARAAYTSE